MIEISSDAAASTIRHGLNGSKVSAQRRLEKNRESNHVATSERDYSHEEMEFLGAVESFKNKTGKKFPTWTEVLSVVHSLGYVKPL